MSTGTATKAAIESSRGVRGFASRLIAPDRTSRILGMRFEENLVKQSIGQTLLACRGEVPSRLALFAAVAELDVVSRSGLAGSLATVFGGSFELRELSQPALRDLLLAQSDASSTSLMIVLIGSEKRPPAWPLPDFGKLIVPQTRLASRKSNREFLETFGFSGDWLRMDRKGAMSVLDRSVISTCWATNLSSGNSPFEYSWGVWSAAFPPTGIGTGALHCETLPVSSKTAGSLVLSGHARERIAKFFNENGSSDAAVSNRVMASFPTPEAGLWLLQDAGLSPGLFENIIFTEEMFGWGPSFSFLRFAADAIPGSRMIVMRDLASIDLMVFR